MENVVNLFGRYISGYLSHECAPIYANLIKKNHMTTNQIAHFHISCGMVLIRPTRK